MFLSVHLPMVSEKEAQERITTTLEEMTSMSWATEEKLNQALRRLRRDDLVGSYFASNQAERIGEAYWLSGDVQQAFERDRVLAQVTAEDVASAWQTWVIEATPVRIYAHKGAVE